MARGRREERGARAPRVGHGRARGGRAAHRSRSARRKYLSSRFLLYTSICSRRLVLWSLWCVFMCSASCLIRVENTATCTSHEPESPGKRCHRATASCTSSWLSSPCDMLAREKARRMASGSWSAMPCSCHTTSASCGASSPALALALLLPLLLPPPSAADGVVESARRHNGAPSGALGPSRRGASGARAVARPRATRLSIGTRA